MLRNLFLCVVLVAVAFCADNSSTVTTVATTAASDATTATAAPGATTATTGGTGTTSSSCADDPNTNCSQYTSLCSNAKYTPLLQQFCPKTCGFCGGGSTVVPVSCVDSSTNCVNWNKNGFCQSTFYTCQQKKDYCAKTCNMCTTSC